MDIDFDEMLNDELSMLNSLVDAFEIPADIFREAGWSYLMIAAQASSKERETSRGISLPGHLRARNMALVEKAHFEFDRLCHSAPHIPRDAMAALSLAYGTFVVIFRDCELDQKHGSYRSQVQVLMAITMARGIAIGHLAENAGQIQHKNSDYLRKKMLSEAGAKGALVRLQPFGELKSWAIEKGLNLGSSKDVARKLSRQLPAHLANVSVDPGRIIYETLLNRDKPS